MTATILYARKSTESEDQQVLSIDSQIKEMQKTAQKGQYGLIEVLHESRSAKRPGRPVFNEMMRRIEKGEVHVILCWKLDRLARNPIDGGRVIWAVVEKGIKIITPFQTYTRDDSTLMLLYIEFGMSNQYIIDLARNVKRGLKTKAEMGWCPSLAPLGYLNRKELEKGKRDVVNDPKRFSLVRKIWDLMLSGNYKPTRILEIANEEWGFRTRRHKRIGDKPLSRSGIYKLLTNPFYAGWFVYKGEIYRGQHEPMISQGEFDRVQELLGRIDKPKPKRHSFAFTGLIRCAECGCLVTAEEKQKANKGDGRVHHYTYYHCTKKKRGIACFQKYLEVKELEKQILAYLEKIQISAKFKDWSVKYLKESHQEAYKDKEEITESLKHTLEKTEKEMETLLKMRSRDLLTDEEYLKEKAYLLKEKQRLQERLDRQVQIESLSLNLTEHTLTFANMAQSWFRQGSLDDKRTIMQAIGSNLSLKDRKLHITAKKPFVILSEGLEKLGQDFTRLEPLKIGLNNEKEVSFNTSFPVWSG